MAGTLYVVGTPIGNLSDITPRALETFEMVDFIACEDTRVSGKLFSHFGIKKPLVSYHEHSQKSVEDSILSRLILGENGAVVTDAGMPCISDPGEDLVRACAENGIDVRVVPGPSAVISALAVSGLITSRFTFEGFLSTTKRQRQEHLGSLKAERRTMIFYEAPHKLKTTLDDMYAFFGDRKISLCRELTKMHEEIIRTTLKGAIEMYRENSPRGEYVLVLEGSQEKEETVDTIDKALLLVKELINNGMRGADACKEIAKTTPFSKGELYTALLSEE